jgi:phosphonate transport system substrate-binding protein
VRPKKIFKRVLQANHQTNLLRVAEGRVDVATSNSTALKRFEAAHPEKMESIRVIWTSPMIASDPIVWRKDLPEDLKAAIRRFLLDYGRSLPGKSEEKLARERSVLAGLSYSGFAESNDLQLTPVRLIELFQVRLRLERDPTLGSDQRASKIEELEARMRTLESPRKACEAN